VWRLASYLVLLTLGACAGAGELRGRSTPSPDGRTYLIVADDNGGACGPVRVDGVPWPHPIGTAGPIAPGTHVLACGTELEIQIDSGQTLHFDYWGP
jgi:hypothetical protein